MSIIFAGGQSHVPQDIQDRLKAINPRLKVVPKQQGVYDSGAEDLRQSLRWVWFVVMTWPEGDPRWQRVKYGQVDPDMAFDVLGQLPPDCPLEQVPGYLSNQIKRSNGHPGDLCDKIAQWNTDQSIRNGAPVSEFAAELFDANKATLFAKEGVVAPKPVSQYNPPQHGKKNRPKEA